MMDRNVLSAILDLARWAPSGDNTQPWAFEIVGVDHILVHGRDTRDWCVYDFDGRPSRLALGALLETLRIAATGFAMRADWSLREECDERALRFDVRFSAAPEQPVDPLFPYIEARAVQRRPMALRTLSREQIELLRRAVGPDFALEKFASLAERLNIARLVWRSAQIRLNWPEAYPTHCAVVEWNARFSKDRIPERAIGIDVMTGKLMRWVMAKWSRVVFFNRFLFGTVTPRIQLDLLPALCCSAHLLLRPKTGVAAPTIANDLAAGAAIQRLWLTTTRLGLHLQPGMAPVIFHWYVRNQRRISARAPLNRQAERVAADFARLVGADAGDTFPFFCRIGFARAPRARSLRRDLDSLMLEPGARPEQARPAG